MLKRLLLLGLVLLPLLSVAQNIDRENFSVKYLRLPKAPLPENVKTYNKKIYIPSLSSGQDRSSIESSVKNAMELHGYEEVESDGDVNIYVSLGTFGYQNRKFNSEKKETKNKEGKVTTYYEYWYTFEYKYPVRLVIEDKANGTELYNGFISNSQDYSSASTDRVRKSDQLSNEWNSTVNKMRSDLLSRHLGTISGYISDEYGFTPSTQYVQLRKIKKFKKFDYEGLNKACEDTETALSNMEPTMDYLTDDLKATLEASLAVWEKELSEADYSEKKARINEKVASVLLNNIAVANYWLARFDKVSEVIEKADGLKSDGWTNSMKRDMEDLMARREANGL
ncbi:hypothetical protein AB9P05_23435 [Roseivirga sp. BDSF3-8]|uniref:hypothetical protein n=1 Tax=Roseivirga sp. BDSF3-8 TaxID=3241598 RepID=UPI0035325759